MAKTHSTFDVGVAVRDEAITATVLQFILLLCGIVSIGGGVIIVVTVAVDVTVAVADTIVGMGSTIEFVDVDVTDCAADTMPPFRVNEFTLEFRKFFRFNVSVV